MNMKSDDRLSPCTLIQHYMEEDPPEGAPSFPLFQNSNFLYATHERFVDAFSNLSGQSPYIYSRVGNPTVDLLERKIAKLEGAEACRATSAGIAAISAVLMDAAEPGAHIVAEEFCYGSVRQMCDEVLSKMGVTLTLVDGRDTQAVFDAVRPETKLIYLESPSSMVFHLQDIRAIAEFARKRGIRTAIDNTYATPLHQRPIELGVDLVIHSCSKYLGGHSDLIGGAICGRREDIDRISRGQIHLWGNIMAPFPAWLVLRGMRTLGVRLRQHESTALGLASWLESRPEVDRVLHPGLESNPQRELFLRQMQGSGGLFSFVPRVQEEKPLIRFLDALRLFRKGVSWGGFESLAILAKVAPSWEPAGFWLVRLFAGLEDEEDLRTDLERALEEIR
ncbi:MAG: PLP-dependent aspartate aminotransferase family protein [Fimbriimonadales bacterium]|nr:PLP-dependent aspartate aminotransferase family protein [Fimbriimonadales bacterium]